MTVNFITYKWPGLSEKDYPISTPQCFLPIEWLNITSIFRSLKTALAYLDTAQSAIKSDTITNEEITLIRTNRAIIYARLGNYKRAAYYFEEAKKYYQAIHLPEQLTNLLLEGTELYEETGNYEVGLQNAFEALSISKENNFTIYRTKSLIRIARSYFDMKQYSLSEKYVLEAIKNAEKFNLIIDQARAYDIYGELLRRRHLKKC